MNPKLQRMQDMLRRTGLLRMADEMRYWNAKRKARQSNKAFLEKHPGFAVPPAHLAYDANNNVDWATYHETGISQARRIVELGNRYTEGQLSTVYEWGCGPSRLLRHFPGLLKDCAIYGSDYNPETIEWCSANIPNVKFAVNGLTPPLPYADGIFDLAFAISVFTHLSAENCLLWIHELRRVVRPGKIMMFSTNGVYHSQFLLPDEKALYDSDQVVTRGKYVEGKKFFLSFHAPNWVRHELLKDCQVLEYLPGGFTGKEQDFWIARV